MKKFMLLLVSFLFLACSSTRYKIDNKTYQAKSQNSRVRYIVVHYTAIDDQRSINALTKGPVSSHYLITTKKKDPIFSLVPDVRRAWHAGLSSFAGRTNLNDNSIGIEIVNPGYVRKPLPKGTPSPGAFIPKDWYKSFDSVQIDKAAFLIKKLIAEHDIAPKNVLGHSDVSPGRKQDPGPLFPWKYLYDKHGIGVWYNTADFKTFYNEELYSKYSIIRIKQEFVRFGYDMDLTDNWDEKSRKIIYSFQMRFRPRKISGNMDLETFAIIKALNKKYK